MLTYFSIKKCISHLMMMSDIWSLIEIINENDNDQANDDVQGSAYGPFSITKTDIFGSS